MKTASVLLIVGTPWRPHPHGSGAHWVAECSVCGALCLAGEKSDLPEGCPRCDGEEPDAA